MKLYIVVDSWDTHFGNGTNIEVFTEKEKAQTYIKEQLDQTIKDWNFDSEQESEEHCVTILDGVATIRDDCDVENWVVFEKEIEVK